MFSSSNLRLGGRVWRLQREVPAQLAKSQFPGNSSQAQSAFSTGSASFKSVPTSSSTKGLSSQQQQSSFSGMGSKRI